jgi:hypothetical protein
VFGSPTSSLDGLHLVSLFGHAPVLAVASRSGRIEVTPRRPQGALRIDRVERQRVCGLRIDRAQVQQCVGHLNRIAQASGRIVSGATQFDDLPERGDVEAGRLGLRTSSGQFVAFALQSFNPLYEAGQIVPVKAVMARERRGSGATGRSARWRVPIEEEDAPPFDWDAQA